MTRVDLCVDVAFAITGISPSLTKFKPLTRSDIIEWDFIAKSIYSSKHTNPKRKVESSLKEGLEDVVREVKLYSCKDSPISF